VDIVRDCSAWGWLSGGANMTNPTSNGWNEWGKHVLAELERNQNDHASMFQRLTLIQTEIATLKVKSGLWGAAAGAIPGIVALIIALLMRGRAGG